MPVPNESSVGTNLDQAELDAGDLTMIENVFQGYAVVSGGAVTAQGSPNGTVAVAAGVAKVGHVAVTITAGNVSVISGSANPDGTTATAADAAQARYSLITINAAGQLGVLHGTPAGLGPNNDGSYLSVFPTFAGKTVLASVWVPPVATTVTSAYIWDKREIHTDGDFIARPITPTALSAAVNDYAPTGLSTANVIRQATNSSTQRNISGIVPTGFADGKTLYLHNLGPGPLGLLDESTNSSAANRFALPNDVVIPVDRSVELQYDPTSARWRTLGAQTASGAPTIALGTTAAPGSLAYYLASDATIAAFDATVPVTQAYSDAAATGVVAFAARRDHRHGMPAGATLAGALSADVVTSETTTSTTYTDLATSGPSVTATIGISGMALVVISAQLQNNTISDGARASVSIAGAAAADVDSCEMLNNGLTGNAAWSIIGSRPILATGLTPGSVTFTMKYRVITGGTAAFVNRRLIVIPL